MSPLETSARAIVQWYLRPDRAEPPSRVHECARVQDVTGMQLVDDFAGPGRVDVVFEELRFFEDQLAFAQVRAVDEASRLPVQGTVTLRFESGVLRELNSSVAPLEVGPPMEPPPLLPTTALVPATLAHREDVYAWLTTDGIVDAMMGWPRFCDSEPPDYEEFCEDWTATFWSDEAPEEGRVFVLEDAGVPVGAFMQNALSQSADGARLCELDLWLAHPACFGKGYAQDGLSRLCAHLAQTLAVEQVFLQPSARNPRGVRAYEKAGFRRVAGLLSEVAARLSVTPDYGDSVFVARSL